MCIKNKILSDRSGKYVKEDYVKKHHPKLYNHITDTYDDNIPFKDKIYLYIFNIKDIPTCKTCGETLTIKYSLKKGFGDYCSVKCMNRNTLRKEQIIKSNLKKYGKKSHNSLKEVKDKKKNTLLKNYGVTNPMKSPIIKDRYNKSLHDNFGVTNSMLIPKVKNARVGLNQTQVKRMINRLSDDYQLINYSASTITLKHMKCDNIFSINSNFLNGRISNDNELCTHCYSKFSIAVSELSKFLDELNINYKLSDRNIIKPLEIDFYIENKNIGIEYHGIFWHSNKYKASSYHYNKYQFCKKNNLSLIQVFENEWFYKKDIVKSIIKTRLGLNQYKLFARKTTVKEVSNKESKEFLEENHIQGYVNSSVKIGLYYSNELVSLMTFGKKRKSLGSSSNNNSEYEIYRFCNKKDFNIIGGASKLFKYFLKNYNVSSVLTYSDNRYFTGDIYSKLDFSYQGDTKPNYYYFKKGSLILENRFKYRKDVLIKEGFDPLKSENTIMMERGYLKIYDAGNKKFIYKKGDP